MLSSDGLSPSKNPFAYVQATPLLNRTRSGRTQTHPGTPSARNMPAKSSTKQKGKGKEAERDSSPLPPSSPLRPAASTSHIQHDYDTEQEQDEDEVEELAMDNTLPLSSDPPEAAQQGGPSHAVPWYEDGQDVPVPGYHNSDFSSDIDSLPQPHSHHEQNASNPSHHNSYHSQSQESQGSSTSSASDPFGFLAVERRLKADRLHNPLDQPKLKPLISDRRPAPLQSSERPPELTPAFTTPANMPPTPHKRRISSELRVASSLEEVDGEARSEGERSTPSPVKRPSLGTEMRDAARKRLHDEEDEEDEGEEQPTTPAPAAKRTRTRTQSAKAKAMYKPQRDSSSDEHSEDEDPESEAEPTPPRPRRHPPRKRPVPDISSPPPRARRAGKRSGKAAASESSRATVSRGARGRGRKVLGEAMGRASAGASTSKSTKAGKGPSKGKGKRKQDELEDAEADERLAQERAARLAYFKKLEGYEVQKENVYVI